MSLSHGELFAGIGGFSEGFRRSGIETRWAVEIDPACRRVLRHHDPRVELFDDVQTVGLHNLSRVDVITFGSPCQDLSVAGKRAGLEGGRSGLFFEAVRVIRELEPEFAIWENVPGALSSSDKRDFAAALSALVGCEVSVPADGWGTCGVVFGPLGSATWRVVDAQYFGVAQRRRRVFVVYDPRADRGPQILIEPDGLQGHPAPRRETGQGVTSLLEVGARTSGDGYRDGDGISDPGDPMYTLQATKQHGVHVPSVAGTLGSNSQGGFRTTDLDQMGAFIPFDLTQITSVANRQRLEAGREAPSLHAAGGAHVIQTYSDELRYACPSCGVRMDAVPRACPKCGHLFDLDGMPVAVRTANTSANGHGVADDVAHTLDGASGGSTHTHVASHMAVRRLTPTECARLQGFPDDWLDLEPPLADSTKYRMLGNAVCVAVSEWLAHRVAATHDAGTTTRTDEGRT